MVCCILNIISFMKLLFKLNDAVEFLEQAIENLLLYVSRIDDCHLMVLLRHFVAIINKVFYFLAHLHSRSPPSRFHWRFRRFVRLAPRAGELD